MGNAGRDAFVNSNVAKIGGLQSQDVKGDEVIDLVNKINAQEKPDRLSAMRVLTNDYKDSAFVIDAVLKLFGLDKIDRLSASGILNALYFLNRTNPDV